jgi:hypothetical protein
MKIYFFWPYTNKPTTDTTEPYEFYKQLEKESLLTDDYNNADYIFYTMHLRNCLNLPYDNISELDVKKITEIFNSGKKEIIIDYNDWTDTRSVPNEVLDKIGFYFKRSMVNKSNLSLVQYNREIIPISYGIRSDFIEYDKLFNFTSYNYNVCCMFTTSDGGIRGIIPTVVNKYTGSKFVGIVDCPNRYGTVNTKYFEILKTSKIIVTANPSNWEGDFRLWEALLMGNLVLCDEMVIPHIMKHPLLHKTHLVFYKNKHELLEFINYYIKNEEERDRIGKEGREYCLKYHKFSDRVEEVIDTITQSTYKLSMNKQLSINKQKKVAIIFFGLTRTLNKTIQSITENLFNPLKRNSIEYDIFIHTYKIHGPYQNRCSGEPYIENYANEDVETILNPKYCIYDDQNEVINNINFNDYYTKLGNWSGQMDAETTKYLIKNMLLGLYSKKKITNLFETYKNEYDYAIITRPEQAILEQINMRFFDQLTDNNIIIPRDNSFTGVNDRFCIAKPNIILYYGTLFDDLKQYSLNKSIISERYLLDKLIEKNLQILQGDIKLQLIRL